MNHDLTKFDGKDFPNVESFRRAVADAMAHAQKKFQIHDRVALAMVAHLTGQLGGVILIAHGDVSEADLGEEIQANMKAGFANAVGAGSRVEH